MRVHYPACMALAAIMLSAFSAAHAASAPSMKPGLYEITVKMDMQGMPQAMPPQTTKRCMTAKDMEDPRKIGHGDDRGDKSTCEVTNYRVQGNTATWNMACKGPEQMTGTGSMTYEGSSYRGINRMTMKQGKDTTNMTMSYSGKYLGECKPGQPSR